MPTAGNLSLARGPERTRLQASLDGWASVRAVTGRSALVALAGFHGWLFWTHATTGRLADPSTAVRWAAAAVLLFGFLTLRRVGRPLMSGRHALVLWLLVAMLHGHAVVGAAERLPVAAVPETVSVVLTQIAAATPAIFLTAGLLLLLARQHVERPRALALTEVRRFLCGAPLAGDAFRFAPRPPPQPLLPA